MAGGTLATGRPGFSQEKPGWPRRLAAQLRHWPDSRVEPLMGFVACSVLLLIVAMLIFVFEKAWPSFSHNGLSWFTSGGLVDRQLEDIYNSPQNPDQYVYTIRAWPLIWGTILTTGGAVIIATFISLFSAVFIVDFAPRWLNRVLEPVVRLLAAVPSVIYGLFALLVIVPWVAEHLISNAREKSVINVIQLSGEGLGVAIVVLSIMITPIMIAINVDSLRAVPSSWSEGAAALGANRWRVIWTISVRTARPAIIAGLVLATGRALGEAIMLSMVSGSNSFAPNLLDGTTFFFEPVRPLAAAIIDNFEGASVEPYGQTLYAFAALLLFSGIFLSLAGFIAKLPMRKYGVRP